MRVPVVPYPCQHLLLCLSHFSHSDAYILLTLPFRTPHRHNKTTRWNKTPEYKALLPSGFEHFQKYSVVTFVFINII